MPIGRVEESSLLFQRVGRFVKDGPSKGMMERFLGGRERFLVYRFLEKTWGELVHRQEVGEKAKLRGRVNGGGVFRVDLAVRDEHAALGGHRMGGFVEPVGGAGSGLGPGGFRGGGPRGNLFLRAPGLGPRD